MNIIPVGSTSQTPRRPLAPEATDSGPRDTYGGALPPDPTARPPVDPGLYRPVSRSVQVKADRQVPGNASAVLKDYPPLQRYLQDATFQQGFRRYMTWVAEQGTPDARFLLPHLGPEEESIEFLSLVFHEQVELQGWLDQGHRLEDILNVDYYQAHYEQVYPVAHSRAVQAETDLVQAYAHRRGLQPAPALALTLVSPMAEQRKVPASSLLRRLKFNPEILEQKVTRQDLQAAVDIYEDGGYTYQDLPRLLDEAQAALPRGRGPGARKETV